MVVGWRTVPPAAWLRVAPSAEVGELEWMVQVGPAGGTERCRLPCERQITNGCAIWTSRLGVVCCRVGKKPSLRGVHRNPIGVQLIVPTAAGLRAKRCKSCCRKPAPTVSSRRRRDRKVACAWFAPRARLNLSMRTWIRRMRRTSWLDAWLPPRLSNLHHFSTPGGELLSRISPRSSSNKPMDPRPAL